MSDQSVALDKLELFSLVAMLGLLSQKGTLCEGDLIAGYSIHYAKALVEALEVEKLTVTESSTLP